MRFSISTVRKHLLFSALLGCALLAGSAQADSAAAKDATPTAHDAEFARFMERSLVSKPAPPAKAEPGAAASCDAGSARARDFATLKQLEAELARLRAQQAAKWKEKGWSPKEAAAAGETVVLNGSGFNIKNSAGGN